MHYRKVCVCVCVCVCLSVCVWSLLLFPIPACIMGLYIRYDRINDNLNLHTLLPKLDTRNYHKNHFCLTNKHAHYRKPISVPFADFFRKLRMNGVLFRRRRALSRFSTPKQLSMQIHFHSPTTY